MDKKARMIQLCNHMVNGGKVVVKDKHDFTVKESSINGIFDDYTVTLSDTIHSEYSINEVTIKPL
jgi:hypothetical protein